MLTLGTQLSSGKGFEHMGREALSIGANTFQFFMRNPRGTKAKAIDPGDIGKLRELLKENAFGPVLAHAPYTLNACSKDPHLRGLSAEMFADDLGRMEYLPGNCYNFHPGSRTVLFLDEAIEHIAKMLNDTIRPGQQTTVLLETMSGKGSEVGGTFEELYRIMEKVTYGDKIGVCFDSCHMWDAGYDLVNGLDGVLEDFDRIIGLKHLRAVHINDSQNPLGSRKDRHAPIGDGTIGLQAVTAMICHPQLRHLPFITETPLDVGGHAAELALLKNSCRKQLSEQDVPEKE